MRSEKYVKLGYLLKDKIENMVENGTFSNISDHFYLEKNDDDLITEVYSILAVIYAKEDDDAKMAKCISKVLSHSKYCLYDLQEDDIIDLWDGMNCDICFWGAFNRIKDLIRYSGYSTNLLIEYSQIVANVIDADDPYDQRMYKYYKEIIRLANQTVSTINEEKRLFYAIFDEDNEGFDENIRFYQNIANEYTYRIEEISGQEYHP